MSDIAIKIKNLSKTFKIAEDQKRTLKELFAARLNQGKTKKFKALDGVDLKVARGEFVGIVGKNGSGKSTLLKLIAGIYSPDSGTEITVNGSLIPFLELGIGFNPEFTGKENIYLNGTILGMTKKQLDEKYDDIVKFAELQKFIRTPVKNYSSGMKVRLAFSIAIQAEADIYLLDEIFAVGDGRFQKKSLEVIDRFVKEGKTIILVSHSMASIKDHCERVIWIKDGKINFDGSVKEGVEKYENWLTG
jgi:ABC-2 type transport system ATP-binding protein